MNGRERIYNAEIAAAVAGDLEEAGTIDPSLLLALVKRLSDLAVDQSRAIDRLERRLALVDAMRRGLEAIDRRVDQLEESDAPSRIV